MAMPFQARGKLFLVTIVPIMLLLAGGLAWQFLPADRETAEPATDYWLGEYFNFYPAEGMDPRLGTTPQTTPAMVRNDGEINFDWGKEAPSDSLPADRFSVRWTRTARFVGGAYRFHARSDDGIRIYIDDMLKLDRWFDNRAAEQTIEVNISPGNHKLKVEYYENWGNASVNFWWEPIPDDMAANSKETNLAAAPANAGQVPTTSVASSSAAAGEARPVSSALAAPLAAPIPVGNLLKNGGFELDSNGDGLPDGWTVSIPDSQFGLATGRAETPEGQSVAAFPPSVKSFTVSQEVEARQGEPYEFSGRVSIPTSGGWFRLALMVIPLDDRGQPLASYDQEVFTQPTSGWVEVKKKSTMPSYTSRVRLQVKADVLRATAYVDDLSFQWAGGN